jgi:hypothetical protein
VTVGAIENGTPGCCSALFVCCSCCSMLVAHRGISENSTDMGLQCCSGRNFGILHHTVFRAVPYCSARNGPATRLFQELSAFSLVVFNTVQTEFQCYCYDTAPILFRTVFAEFVSLFAGLNVDTSQEYRGRFRDGPMNRANALAGNAQ